MFRRGTLRFRLILSIIFFIIYSVILTGRSCLLIIFFCIFNNTMLTDINLLYLNMTVEKVKFKLNIINLVQFSIRAYL